MSVTQSVRRRGLAATHELHADGYGRGAIATAVSAGDIIRVRQGWYAPTDLNPLLLQASRVGGALTCLSGLSLQGCWTFPDPESDRRRDAIASALGYRVLRFSYWQVVERWAEVEAAAWAAVSRGDHH